MKKIILVCLPFLISITSLQAQTERKDKGEFTPSTNPFLENIKKTNHSFNQEKKAKPLTFRMDHSGIDIPKSPSEFKSVWAGEAVSQGETGTCWCFSTTSFYESEIYRITKQQIRLSELFTVYWQYVEKARGFVNTRGKSEFSEGSETNAVAMMMKKYGTVPNSSYLGMKPGQKYHDHKKMFEEMNLYLQSIKSANAWDENMVISTIKSIMNFYMGEPPKTVSVNGKNMTPQEYLKNVTKLNPDDYVDFMSLLEKPYWSKAEYDVSDNWWNSEEYYNLPLNDFMNIIKNALKSGYSISIGGDVSESGINPKLGVAMIPTYDIPSAFIDDNARQFRFSNKTTTDDHAMHLTGYLEKPNGMWFLLKDSGSSGHNNETSPGYWYYHEDYIKLKMMTITLHKDAVKELLQKFAVK